MKHALHAMELSTGIRDMHSVQSGTTIPSRLDSRETNMQVYANTILLFLTVLNHIQHNVIQLEHMGLETTQSESACRTSTRT